MHSVAPLCTLHIVHPHITLHIPTFKYDSIDSQLVTDWSPSWAFACSLEAVHKPICLFTKSMQDSGWFYLLLFCNVGVWYDPRLLGSESTRSMGRRFKIPWLLQITIIVLHESGRFVDLPELLSRVMQCLEASCCSETTSTNWFSVKNRLDSSWWNKKDNWSTPEPS